MLAQEKKHDTSQASVKAVQLQVWTDLYALLKGISMTAKVSVLVCELEAEDNLRTICEMNENALLPIASSFRLWILKALEQRICESDDDSIWDKTVPVTSMTKSIPCDEDESDFYYLEEGTKKTVRELLERMIVHADATATDVLFHYLGRIKIQQILPSLMSRPHSNFNTPLWNTREMQVAKYLWNDARLKRRNAASLDREPRGWDDLDRFFQRMGQPTKPERIYTVEWFSSCREMTSAFVDLWRNCTNNKKLLPIREALSKAHENSNVPIDNSKFSTVAYVGGNELGVMSGNWILELPGGRRCTCSIAWADDSITSSVFQTLRRRTLPEIVLGAFQLLHDSS